jgi:acyl-CoA reductase-like NAD-dependent aldehyde dehydrogenase
MITYGDPADPATYMGPLISERQRDKVEAMVKRAVAAGATLVTGGNKVNPGFFYEPTLLTHVDPDSEIAQDEVFGPVLIVIAYDDDDDAVRIANNSIFGLSGAVIGSNDRAIAVGRRIRTGTLSINGGNYSAPDSPLAVTSSRASAGRWASPGSRSSWSARHSRRWSGDTAEGSSRSRSRDVWLCSLGRGGSRRMGC